MNKSVKMISIILVLLLMSVPVIVMATNGGILAPQANVADVVSNATVTPTPVVIPVVTDASAVPAATGLEDRDDDDDRDDDENRDDDDDRDDDEDRDDDDDSIDVDRDRVNNSAIDAIIKMLEDMKI